MGSIRLVIPLLLGCLGARTAVAQTLIARVNAGGPALTDELGQSWQADQPYAAGSHGYQGGFELTLLSRQNGRLVGGPDNPLRRVYNTGRAAWSAYRFDLPAGDYLVRLTLAEIWNQGPRLRSMSVQLEGTPFLVDEDLAARLGVQYGGQVAARVHVADGRLDVVAAPGPGVDPRVDGPLVCGLEVWSAPSVFPALPPVQDLEARAGYGVNLLSWAWESEPVLGGWRIWCLDAAPFGPPAAPSSGWVRLADVWSAPARFHDHTARVGVARHYRVAALGLDGSVGARSASVSAAALDGAETSLPRYRLTLTPDDQLFIDRNIFLQPDEEVPATFTFGAEARAAEARYRGNSSRLFSKKSWKIKFPGPNAFEGRRELNLKASFFDPSVDREHLAHALFEAVGQASSEIRPVHLEVNGRYLGLFNEAEEVDAAWLALRDRATSGDLFKAESNMELLPSPDVYELLYEKKTNEATGHAALIEFIEFLNAPPSSSFLRELADRFDVDSFLSYLAVVAWIGDLDAVLHNYYLHQDHTLARWELLPWDSDLTFALGPNQMNLSILFGAGVVPGEPLNQLRKRVLDEPALLWRFCQKLVEMQELFANDAWLDAQIDVAVAARREDAHADPYKYGWERAETFESDVAALRSYAAVRTPIVDQELALVQPASPPTALWINELAAEAQTGFLDEAAEAEDWLELYNAGTSALDLGGLYLTDDLADPTRWSIPAGTVLAPGAHLAVWCDAEPADGPLHTTFELAAAGGELGLFAADGTTLVDFICWTRQYADTSFGRHRDGGQLFQRLPTPTLGLPNTTAGNSPPALSWVNAAPAAPTSSEAVEVTCHARDADGLAAVALHWRAGGGAFGVLALAPLARDRFAASIPAQADGTTVEYYVTATDVLGRSSSKPAEGASAPYQYVVDDAGVPPLVVNELLASNATTLQDEAGDFEDWIEVHNTSASALDVGGMFLSDDLGNSTKWQIPSGTVIAGGGYLLFWADDEPLEGPLHATFKLGAGGEAAAIFDRLAAGNGLIHGFSYGAQSSDVSHGTLPDGGSLAYLLSSPSPAASNLPAPGAARGYEHVDPAANPIQLAGSGSASIGGSVGLVVSNAPASKPGTIAFGLVPVDVDFPGLGFALVAPLPAARASFSTSGSGSASPSLALPNDASLIGIELYSQAFVVSGGLSNGVVTTIGP